MQQKYAGRLIALLAVAILACAPAAWGADAGHGIYQGVSQVERFDISPPLRDITYLPAEGRGPEREVREGKDGEDLDKPLGPQDVDISVQDWIGSGEIPAPSVTFNGPPNVSSVSPPDPVGDVGPNHYVAMSNLSFQIFDKAGNSLFGPAPTFMSTGSPFLKRISVGIERTP